MPRNPLVMLLALVGMFFLMGSKCDPPQPGEPEEPDNPCAAVRCAAGTECVVQQVQCVRAPCPPVAVCAGPCQETGCSGQICADQDIATTCEFRPIYACYQLADCRRQEDGRCGWVGGGNFDDCLENGGPVE